MANGKSFNRPRTVKFDKDEDNKLSNYCSKLGIDVSTFIRNATNERINSVNKSHLAGNNFIEYNQKQDNFSWKIKLDTGEEKIILEDVSLEFLEDLQNKINTALHDRDTLLKKKTKKSVSVPRRLVE
jgi:hypothetical protein